MTSDQQSKYLAMTVVQRVQVLEHYKAALRKKDDNFQHSANEQTLQQLPSPSQSHQASKPFHLQQSQAFQQTQQFQQQPQQQQAPKPHQHQHPQQPQQENHQRVVAESAEKIEPEALLDLLGDVGSTKPSSTSNELKGDAPVVSVSPKVSPPLSPPLVSTELARDCHAGPNLDELFASSRRVPLRMLRRDSAAKAMAFNDLISHSPCTPHGTRGMTQLYDLNPRKEVPSMKSMEDNLLSSLHESLKF